MEPATEEASQAPRPHPPLSPPPDLQQQQQETQEFPAEADDDVPTDITNSNANGAALPPLSQSPASSTKSRPLSGVVPPYWRRHDRNASRASQTSLARSTLITLEDHTADPDSATTRGLWARSVSIDDHAVVQGMTGIGSYVVWNCTIQTLDVSIAMSFSGIPGLTWVDLV
jgi:hypothetical protein